MAAVEVRGLREAAKNLEALGKVGATELSRDALRDGARVLVRSIKAATYTTFQRQTGFIKSGFGAVVAKDLKSGVLRAWVMQLEQSLAGGSAEKKAQRAAHLPKSKGRKQSFYNVAFYWRFLEFGTQGRRTATTPKFHRAGRIARGKRQEKALGRYNAGKSLGDISPRPWVRPAFAGSAASSIETFEKSFRTRIETAVKDLPKK